MEYTCTGMGYWSAWLAAIGAFSGVGGGAGLMGRKCLLVNVSEGIALGKVNVGEGVTTV